MFCHAASRTPPAMCHEMSCFVMVPMREGRVLRPGRARHARFAPRTFRRHLPSLRPGHGSLLPAPVSFRPPRRRPGRAAGPCFARIARARARVCTGAVRAPDCAREAEGVHGVGPLGPTPARCHGMSCFVMILRAAPAPPAPPKFRSPLSDMPFLHRVSFHSVPLSPPPMPRQGGTLFRAYRTRASARLRRRGLRA